MIRAQGFIRTPGDFQPEGCSSQAWLVYIYLNEDLVSDKNWNVRCARRRFIFTSRFPFERILDQVLFITTLNNTNRTGTLKREDSDGVLFLKDTYLIYPTFLNERFLQNIPGRFLIGVRPQINRSGLRPSTGSLINRNKNTPVNHFGWLSVAFRDLDYFLNIPDAVPASETQPWDVITRWAGWNPNLGDIGAGWPRQTNGTCQRRLETGFTSGRGVWDPRLDLKFTEANEPESFSGGSRNCWRSDGGCLKWVVWWI